MDKQHSTNPRNCVSVIIPTHNSENTLRVCLGSVISQTYKMREIIVADNFSTDSTIEAAKQMGVIALPRSGKPGNVSSSKNFGLANSSGNYVLFLDSDEILEAKVIEECIELCEMKNYGMVKIPIRFVGKGFWSSSSAFWRNCHYNVGKRTIGNFPRFFKREYLTRITYNESLVWGEDWELYVRMKAEGADETYCKSHMLHLEPQSLREMMLKHIGYTKAIPTFSLNITNRIYLSLVKNAGMAFVEAIRNPPTPPYILAGSFVFICFKSIAMFLGFLRENLI